MAVRSARVFAIAFVGLWSTGFIVARFAMPHAPVLGFLCVRYGFTCLALLPLLVWNRPRWPAPRDAWHLAGIGLLVHGGYLTGVWGAVKAGMPAGVAALIVNLQPVLTALIMSGQGQRIALRTWLGLALGFSGVALVVLRGVSEVSLGAGSVVLAVVALVSISVGTAWQKIRIPSFDLRTGTLVQYGASLALSLPLSWMLESQSIDWIPAVMGAMAWSVIALSIVAVFLMFRLIERGGATEVASLFYLVPPCTALLGWLLFDERFGPAAWAGIALAAIGVWMVRSTPPRQATGD